MIAFGFIFDLCDVCRDHRLFCCGLCFEFSSGAPLGDYAFAPVRCANSGLITVRGLRSHMCNHRPLCLGPLLRLFIKDFL